MSLRMNRTTLMAVSLAALSGLARGADDVELLDAMYDALGGRQAIAGLRSLRAEADCAGGGATFTTRVQSFRPDHVHFVQADDGFSTEIWSTPDRTWTDAGEAGVQGAPPGTRAFVRSHEFHLLLFEAETRFSNHVGGDDQDLDGRTCRVVHMDDEWGQPATLFLDADDGLPVALDTRPPGAPGSLRLGFSDWREVEGLRCFFAFELSEGPGRSFRYDYHTLELDGVDATTFVPRAPAGQRADQEALLAILADERLAYLEGDAGRFTRHLADRVVERLGGDERSRTRAEYRASLQAVLAATSFRSWEDALPPAIAFSPDGDGATVVRRVRSRRSPPDDGGEPPPDRVTTATFRKQAGVWRLTAVTYGDHG